MSSTAYIIPFDHQSSTQITDGVDASKLWSLTPQGEKPPKAGTTRIFYNTPPSKVTTVSSLGEGFTSKKSEVKRELVRKSVGSAVKGLKDHEGLKDVLIDASADPHAAGVSLYLIQRFYMAKMHRPSLAVAAHLALYSFTLKTSPPSRFDPNQTAVIPEKFSLAPLQESKEWERGVVYAQAQNLARTVYSFRPYMWADELIKGFIFIAHGTAC